MSLIVFGNPIYVWGGILTLLLLIWQVLGGRRIVKINFKQHKWDGIIILVMACFHGFLAFSANQGWFY